MLRINSRDNADPQDDYRRYCYAQISCYQLLLRPPSPDNGYGSSRKLLRFRKKNKRANSPLRLAQTNHRAGHRQRPGGQTLRTWAVQQFFNFYNNKITRKEPDRGSAGSSAKDNPAIFLHSYRPIS
jgi:hypothetical protein